MKSTDEQSAIEGIAKFLSGSNYKNEKIDIAFKVLDSLMPALLSSIFTIYSAVSSSFVYNYSLFLYNGSIIIFIFFLLGIMWYPVFKVASKVMRIKGVTILRQISNNEDTYRIIDKFKPIREGNPMGAIKSTIYELSEVAFVILFPGGFSDVLIGMAENSPTIGLNGTGQLELGCILVTASIVFLFITALRYKNKAKKQYAMKIYEMKNLVYKINEKLEKSPRLEILFDNIEESGM